MRQGGIFMQKYQKYVQLLLFLMILSIAINNNYNPFQTKIEYEGVLSEIRVDTFDKLYEKILQKSEEIAEDAEDAYIDRVWKKTPGRNGLRINIDESYKRMKKAGEYNEQLLVTEEITPKKDLSDLPAAPIYRGHPKKEMVTLLINVSWGTEYIPEILQTVKEKNVKANFFIEGKWAQEHPNLVKMIAEQNHIIGNHAYNHPNMARMNRQDVFEQINRTNEILQAITGNKPKWFAPPSGSFNEHVVEVAYELKMETILWTVDTIDWKKPSVSVMLNRVLTKVHPGAMILMHPTEPVSKGLGELINELEKKGYKIDHIENLLNSKRE